MITIRQAAAWGALTSAWITGCITAMVGNRKSMGREGENEEGVRQREESSR